MRVRAAGCASIAGLAACVTVMAADLEVRSPIVDVHEFEADYKLAVGRDRRPAVSGARSAVVELEYGVNAWWSPAIEGEWTRTPGNDPAFAFEATTFESRFQLAPHGARWADLGVFVEIERGVGAGPHSLRVGPLLRKDFGAITNVLNLLAVREWGAESRRGTSVAYAWQSRWRLSEEFQPGVEVYGGTLDAGAVSPRQHLGGPVAFGAFDLARHQDLRYEIGYLRGLAGQTPRGTVKILLGYEYRFD